jgi:uncharacterized protein YggU (UPF0235/DUF167 family)
VTIIAGETARLKRLHVAGDPHTLARIAQATSTTARPGARPVASRKVATWVAIRVRRPAANALVAKHFGVPKRAVTIIAGETARLKRLHVAGDPHTLNAPPCPRSAHRARHAA